MTPEESILGHVAMLIIIYLWCRVAYYIINR